MSDRNRPTAAQLARHEMVYGPAGGPPSRIPPFEFNQVADRIYAGRCPLTAVDSLRMLDVGVNNLVDVRENLEWAPPDRFGEEAIRFLEHNLVNRIAIPIPDTMAPPPHIIRILVEAIEDVMSRPHNTLYVCCRAGQERSATVLTAWHAWHYGVSYEEALAELQRGRPKLRPLPHQAEAVRNWLEFGG